MKIVDKFDQDVKNLTAAMQEKQPLPIGKSQFIEWSDRIISGAMVDASVESLRFSLAAMLMHLGPTEAMKEDGYFILSLRKAAVNQTAHVMIEELKEDQRKKLAEDTAPNLQVAYDGSVLENKKL